MDTLQPGSSSWDSSGEGATAGEGSSSGGGVGSVGPDRGPARKRKQNQACSACKSRKVKCDSVDLPEGSVCSPCMRKGIKCVVQKPQGPRRINRSGVRVEMAKRELGAVDYTGSAWPSTVAPTPGPSTHSLPTPAADPVGGPPSSTPSTNLTGVVTDAELDDILRSLSDSDFTWLPPVADASQRQLQQADNSLPVISLSSAAHQLQIKTLEGSMEQDLLQTFFNKAHFAVQAVDPETFRTMYNLNLRNPTFMTPVNQTICAFMAAWGARYTTHPSILPPGLNLIDCGQAREVACNSLFRRAFAMMDEHGILRTPSVDSVQCLILASQLSLYNEDLSTSRGAIKGTESGMDTVVIKGAMASHIQACSLWDSAQGQPLSNSLDVTEIILHVKNQRVLWTAWIGDSFWSLGYHGRPSFDDDAIFEVPPGGSIPRLSDPLPRLEGLSTLHCFTLLLFSFPMLGELLRYAGNHLHFRGQRGRVEDKTAQLPPHLTFYQERLAAFKDWLDAIAERVLGRVPTLSTFSPVIYYVSVGFGVAQMAFMSQRILNERLEKALKAASLMRPSTVFDTVDGSPKEDAHLVMLRTLARQSSTFALIQARKLALLAHRLNAGPHLDSAGTEHRELRSIATFMAESETTEQMSDYEDERLDDWTWERKCIEVGWLLDTIVRFGWSWGLSGIATTKIVEIMERSRPPGCPKFAKSYANLKFSPDELYERQRHALHPKLQLANAGLEATEAYTDQKRALMVDHWHDLSRVVPAARPLDAVLVGSEPLFAPPFKLVLRDDEPDVPVGISGTAGGSQLGLLRSTQTSHGFQHTPRFDAKGNDSDGIMWSSGVTLTDTLGDFIDNLL